MMKHKRENEILKYKFSLKGSLVMKFMLFVLLCYSWGYVLENFVPVINKTKNLAHQDKLFFPTFCGFPCFLVK